MNTIIYRIGLIPLVAFLAFTLAFLSFDALADNLLYQDRGNRHEGIKSEAISAGDIELISALVDYREQAVQLPHQLKIRFYLKQSNDVDVLIREVDNRYYYWMDKIEPRVPWRKATYNEFAWPTKDVLQHIVQRMGPMNMYDLGAVARLGSYKPQLIENVAPIIFYHTQLPAKIEGYLFTFKIGNDARIQADVYRGTSKDSLFTQTFRRQRYDRPFVVHWKSKEHSEGEYKIIVTGYFLDSGRHFAEEVHFYHKPNVK
jgi:hypothetical protein